MRDTIDVRTDDLVEVVNAESVKGKPKPTFSAGEILTVHYVTADRRALSVRGHNGLWRAYRFKPV